jgi:hypothetical protein
MRGDYHELNALNESICHYNEKSHLANGSEMAAVVEKNNVYIIVNINRQSDTKQRTIGVAEMQKKIL